MKRTKHGFTLVELIIVIAVIGVLASILIPTFSNVIDKANAKSALSDARNTVTQYLTDSFDKSLPENLVVVIKKANNYYLYGYNTTGEGSIQVSSGNPYRGLADVTALMNKYSWNAKQNEMTPPDPNTEYTDVDTYGAFYLVPYTGSTPDVDVKGFHAGKAAVDIV